MRSNISLFAVLLLLSACGGRANYDYAPELAAAPPQGSVGAQSWGQPGQRAPASAPQAVQPQQSWAPPQDQSSETWRAADGTLRTRSGPVRQQPQPQQQPGYDSSAPGATYAQPGASYALPRPAETIPAQNYAPPPSQDDPAAGATGPRGSSADIRYDEVGYAGVRPVAGGAMDGAVVAVHRSLPPGSFVEVTSLDTGKTILAMVTGSMGPGADHPIDLSAGSARLLGYSGAGTIPVRIRIATATGPDQAALRSGRPAGERPDTPPVLLTALRKHLPGAPGGAIAAPQPSYSTPVRSAPSRPAPVRTAPGGRYFVQIAALSSAARAQSLAQSMGGFVKPGGGLYRVQLGPFATSAQAQAARQRAAGAGYGDARVLAN